MDSNISEASKYPNIHEFLWEHIDRHLLRCDFSQTALKLRASHLRDTSLKTLSKFEGTRENTMYTLVGGWTNPSEKYVRQIGFIFPKVWGGHKEILETTK